MTINEINQLEFSSILFDTLFGLVLFFSFDSFLQITNPFHFLLYLFGTIILVHWWFSFKSADDTFGKEVTDSAADLVIGIIDVILIDYIISLSKQFNIIAILWVVVALLAVDLLWACVWRFIGQWDSKDNEKIKKMERQLNRNIFINLGVVVLFLFLLGIFSLFTAPLLVVAFVLTYCFYILLTFKYKIIDVKIF